MAGGEDTGVGAVVRGLACMGAGADGQGLSLTGPGSTPAPQTHVGSAVKWDTKRAQALFTAIKNDDPLTGAPAGTSS